MNTILPQLGENRLPDGCPRGLYEKVMSRIERERKIMAVKRRLLCLAGMFAISVIISPVLFVKLQQQLIASGLWQILGTGANDLGIIAAYWQDFILMILEIMPVFNLIGALTSVLVFLLSIRLIDRQLAILNDLSNKFKLNKQYEI